MRPAGHRGGRHLQKRRYDRGYRMVTPGIKELEKQLKEQDQKLEAAKKELDQLRVELKISDMDAMSTAPQMLNTTEEYKRYVASRFELDRYLGPKRSYDKLSRMDLKALRRSYRVSSPTPLLELINELNAADQKFASLANDLAHESGRSSG